MALPEFSYVRPHSIREAVTLLQEHGGDARVLAGGQTLIPLLNMRLVRPRVVVDIGGIAALQSISRDGDGVRIGALTRHREVQQSPLLAQRCPLLPAAAGLIGHSHIRNRGTIGGSIAHADPAAEYPVALLALEATIEMFGPRGGASLPAAEFFLGPLLTALPPTDLVTALRVPPVGPSTGWDFRELVLRSGDFALVSVACLLTVQDHRIATARLAVGGAGPMAVRLPETEASLLGEPPGAALWQAAGRTAATEVEAVDDATATADYRRAVTAVYVEEALAAAAARLEV